MAFWLSLCIQMLVCVFLFLCHQHFLNINTSADGFLIALLNLCIPCFWIITANIINNGFSVCSQFKSHSVEWRGCVRVSASLSFPPSCRRVLVSPSPSESGPALWTEDLLSLTVNYGSHNINVSVMYSICKWGRGGPQHFITRSTWRVYARVCAEMQISAEISGCRT